MSRRATYSISPKLTAGGVIDYTVQKALTAGIKAFNTLSLMYVL